MKIDFTKLSTWENTPDSIDDWLGFVYVITSPEGRKYVGKKLFWSSIRRKPLKGQKRHRRDSRESDWKKYVGSSNELLADLERLGPVGWRREILSFHTSKWDLAYNELMEQLRRDVLSREDYYNGIIHVRLSVKKKQLCRIRRRKKKIETGAKNF